MIRIIIITQEARFVHKNFFYIMHANVKIKIEKNFLEEIQK